jgi:tRNA(His) 5'-end guanylyltransferase
MNPFRIDSARAFAAAAVSCACALPLVLAVPWPNAVIEVLAVTALLFVAYVRLTFLFGMSDEDKQLFDAGIARFKRRRQVTATAVRGEVGA